MKVVYFVNGVKTSLVVDNNCKKLHFKNCMITDITFENCENTKLSELDLSRNLLSSIHNCNFPQSLKILILEDNKIESIDNVQFPCKLEQLELALNSIKSISKIIFPKTIEYLNLSNMFHSLKFIDQTNITWPENLKSLNICPNFALDKFTIKKFN